MTTHFPILNGSKNHEKKFGAQKIIFDPPSNQFENLNFSLYVIFSKLFDFDVL